MDATHIVDQALILVGGGGTRLGALTRNTPKPMLPMPDGRPFLDHVLDRLARGGIKQALLLAGHHGDQVRDRYDGRLHGAMRVEVEIEAQPLGTAGAVKAVEDRLDPMFVLTNGDTLFECPIPALADGMAPDDVGYLALVRLDDGARYGVVDSYGGRVTGFREKDPDARGRADISAGFYLLRRSVTARIGPGFQSMERDVFPGLVAEDRLGCRAFDSYFIDIGIPESLAQARRDIEAGRTGA